MKKNTVIAMVAVLTFTLSACSTQPKAEEKALNVEQSSTPVVEMTEDDTFLMPVGQEYTEKNPRDNKEYSITIDFVNEYIGDFNSNEGAVKEEYKAVEIDFTVTNTGEEPLILPNDVFISLIDKSTSKEYSRTLDATDATHPQLGNGTIEPGETKTFTKVTEIPQELSIYECMIYFGATVGFVTWDVENSITGGE
ncbi:MAG: hypothetical protein ACRDAO_03100 [Culicoidibacterales bacterium]